MGGSIKIDSVQNVITLRSDLHDAWDNYEYGIDPTVSFVSRYILGPSILGSLSRTATALLLLPMEMRT